MFYVFVLLDHLMGSFHDSLASTNTDDNNSESLSFCLPTFLYSILPLLEYICTMYLPVFHVWQTGQLSDPCVPCGILVHTLACASLEFFLWVMQKTEVRSLLLDRVKSLVAYGKISVILFHGSLEHTCSIHAVLHCNCWPNLNIKTSHISVNPPRA